jgi:hypothetical protein
VTSLSYQWFNHRPRTQLSSSSVFVSVVAGAFQITFRAKIHVNDVFSFFKNYFWHQYIKTIQNIQTILNFSKKKIKLNFLGTQPQPRFQTFMFVSGIRHLSFPHECRCGRFFFFFSLGFGL